METIPWYKSAIIRQQIVALIAAVIGLLNIQTDIDIDATITAIFGGIAAIIPIYTIITRMIKPNPPITETAAQKEEEFQKKLRQQNAGSNPQSGFARVSLMGLIAAAAMLVAVVGLTGCKSLNPVRAAETSEQRAYALYGSFIVYEEAATKLIQDPEVPESLKDGIRELDSVTKPVADSLIDAAVTVLQIRAEVAAGETDRERLIIAIENLDRYINEAAPRIKALGTAVREAT